MLTILSYEDVVLVDDAGTVPPYLKFSYLYTANF
jgi:hypothetical protein